MASLYVNYFGAVENGCASAPLDTEIITTSGTSAQGGAIPASSAIAMLYCDTAVYIKLGTNPTAAAGEGAYVPGGAAFWLDLKGNSSEIIAAIDV
jgi:hypothetical protein